MTKIIKHSMFNTEFEYLEWNAEHVSVKLPLEIIIL